MGGKLRFPPEEYQININYSYLFDIFLGPSYNQLPPSVYYMTVRHFSILHILIYCTLFC